MIACGRPCRRVPPQHFDRVQQLRLSPKFFSTHWHAMADRKKPPQVVLLGASFGTQNLGVNALAHSAISGILAASPDAQIYLWDYGKQPLTYSVRTCGRKFSVPLINLRFSWKVFLPNNIGLLIFLAALARVMPLQSLRRKIIAANSWLRRLQEADVVCALSGGDSFSDIYGIKRLLYVSLPQILALLLDRPLVLLPQTIGPFQKAFSRSLARYILRRSHRIYSRDYRDLGGLHAGTGLNPSEARPRFCYDIAFSLETIAPKNQDVAGKAYSPARPGLLVGLNVSGLLFTGGHTRENSFGLRVNYAELVNRLLAFCIEEKQATVLLVPHVFGTDCHSESDQVVCERLYSQLKEKYKDRLDIVRGTCDQNEIKYWIGRSDLFLGSRMHACIAAVSQHVPTIGLAYSGKFEGVLGSLGIKPMVLDLCTCSEPEIMMAVKDCFDNREIIRLQLRRKIAEVKSTVKDFFVEVVEVGETESLSTSSTMTQNENASEPAERLTERVQ